MDGEVQLIDDGDGLAVIGDSKAIEAFLRSEGLPSKELDMPRLSQVLSGRSSSADTASAIAAGSGRWVQISEKTAAQIKKYGLMKIKESGLSLGVVHISGQEGGINVQLELGELLGNPMVLSGAAGIMAQYAMQQAMNEVTDYLAVIDAKVDDILRAQKDAVLSDMIGAGYALEEAMTIRNQVGRVSEVNWSKIQTTSMIVARTQAYALRQLDALAEKIEKKDNVGDIAKISKETRKNVFEWLAVLARSIQLQDAFSILELDRVLDSSADEWDKHRKALREAKSKRLKLISKSTNELVRRLDVAAEKANAKVLLHPLASGAIVGSSNEVADDVRRFNELLGIAIDRSNMEARQWSAAAIEARDKAIAAGTEGVEATMRFGEDVANRAKKVTGTIGEKFGGLIQRSSRDRDK